MKVNIFVDWHEEEILTEKEYKERLDKVLADKEQYRDYECDYLEEHIEEWLDEHHCSRTFKNVFHFSEEERKEILDVCRKGYEETVKQNFSEDWDEIEIEI